MWKAISLLPRPVSQPVPKRKHQLVADLKGWVLERSLCAVPEANAVNPRWCPCLAFRSIQGIYAWCSLSFDLTYFHVGEAVVLLEEGAGRVQHLTGLSWSCGVGGHSRQLNGYS